MNNVGEKFLPLGSVVMLKGASKRLMITGFCTMAADDESGAMYDYSGCMYPEGVISSDHTALFNHYQIEKVYHVGLIDEEEKTFKAKLIELLNSPNEVSQTVVSQPVEVSVAPIAESTPVVPVRPVEAPVPPIGPGLPGYVAPIVEPVPVAEPTPVTPLQPIESNGFQFEANGNVIAAPQVQEAPQTQPKTPFLNIQFDENGTVVSA